jgi:O-antigen/teichoic acid export membrane protein
MAYFPPILLRPGLFLMAIAVMPLLAWPRSSETVMVVAFITCLLTVVIQAVMFAARLPTPPRGHRPSYHSLYWLRISLPVFLAEGILLVLWQVDILMLGGIIGPESVAIYNACVKTAGLVFFVFNALVALAVPRFAAIHARGDRQELQAFVRSVARWIFWPSVGVVLVVLLVGKLVLSLFGPAFIAGYVVLVILTIGFLLSATTGPTSEYLIASGHQDSILLPNITTAVVNIVFNALLIPRFGAAGAGMASFLSLALLTTWFFVLVRRRLRINAIFI